MILFAHPIRSLVLVITLLVFAQTAVHAQLNSEQEYQRSIKAVGQKIIAITRTLNSNKAELKTERDRLFKTEQQLNEISRSIELNDQAIISSRVELEELNDELITTLASQETSREALQALIVSRYKKGDDNYIKQLLNQENPYAVGRLNNYHNYFSKALQGKFAVLQLQATELNSLKAKQNTATQSLALKKQRQSKQKEILVATKKARSRSIAKLDTSVSQDSKKLKQLNKDRQRLDNLIEEIAKQKVELARIEKARRAQEVEERAAKPPPSKPIAKQSPPVKRPIRALVKGGFLKQKGRLRYPVDANRKRNFGSRLAASGMTSDGIFFATAKRQPVTSIFRGQVLFADFLKGYGLLLIIDHGDEHISLYGHNEVLYKKVGDAVDTNEVVAKTGVTGGLKSPGLYFEIRNNATPVNPAKWCQ